MLKIGNRLFGAGVVHGAAYAGVSHDAIATTSRFLLDPSIQAVEGVNLVDAIVATFTDADPNPRAQNFAATINWGDGTTSAGVVIQDASDPTVFYVQGTKTYADDGTCDDPATTFVSIRDLGGTYTEIIDGVPVTFNGSPSEAVPAPFAAVVGDAPITSPYGLYCVRCGRELAPDDTEDGGHQ